MRARKHQDTGSGHLLDRINPRTAVPLLLGLFALLAVHSMRQKGSTFDECAHLPAGYSYLVTGDFRMSPDHPPLARVLAALPLLLTDVNFSRSWPEWQAGSHFGFGSRFLYDANDASTLLFLGRLPIVGMGCLLGLLIWLWAREVAGRTAAYLALFLFVLSPDFLAHSQVVTTDVAVTTFMFASAYFAWRLCRRWSPANAVLAGVSLGAALAAKFSAIVILPTLAAYGLARVISKTPWPYRVSLASKSGWVTTTPARFGVALATAGAVLLLSLSVIWASYGFRYAQPLRPDGTPFYNWGSVSKPGSLGASALIVARSAHLVPEPYVYGLRYTGRTTQARVAFLNGMHSVSGWWYYFVGTFFVKTPVPEILAILAALALLARRLRERPWNELALVLPAALYMATALASNINIGHRHLLPVYPFLLVLAGEAVARLLQKPRLRAPIALLLMWQALSVVSVHPSYLAYFNEVVGGPDNGWKLLADSNLDWGQELPALKRWMDDTGVKTVRLSYFGTGVPEYYGIDYEALPSFAPLRRPLSNPLTIKRGDLVAVSATNLQEVYLRSPRYASFNAFLRRLRTERKPVAVIGHSIFVFETPEDTTLQLP